MVWLANRYRAEKLNLPPSPPRLPIIGNLHQLGSPLHRYLNKLSEKYGPIMLLHLGYFPIVVVSSAEIAREIKGTHDITFANRPHTTAMKMLSYGCINIGFSPYGEHWKRLRRVAQMELLNNKKVQSFRNVREEEIALMVQKITSASSVRSPVNLSELALTLANDIICRCALGTKDGGQDGKKKFAGEFFKLMTAFSFGDLFTSFGGWIDNITGLTGRIIKLTKDLDMYCDQIIDEHLVQNNLDDPDYNQDFVDVLLQVQKNDANFTRDTIKALILDMIIGATESTATTIEWTMAELLQNPNVMRKAQEEVRRVAGQNKMVKEEDLQKMEYLKLVVEESMRLRPGGGLNLVESSKATNVKGFHLPAKTTVLLNIWSIQRNSKYWERPDEFIPERFSNNDVNYGGHDFNLTPFGSGRRICPGRTKGYDEVEIIERGRGRVFSSKLTVTGARWLGKLLCQISVNSTAKGTTFIHEDRHYKIKAIVKSNEWGLYVHSLITSKKKGSRSACLCFPSGLNQEGWALFGEKIRDLFPANRANTSPPAQPQYLNNRVRSGITYAAAAACASKGNGNGNPQVILRSGSWWTPVILCRYDGVKADWFWVREKIKNVCGEVTMKITQEGEAIIVFKEEKDKDKLLSLPPLSTWEGTYSFRKWGPRDGAMDLNHLNGDANVKVIGIPYHLRVRSVVEALANSLIGILPENFCSDEGRDVTSLIARPPMDAGYMAPPLTTSAHSFPPGFEPHISNQGEDKQPDITAKPYGRNTNPFAEG
ncbi:Cytochrome p450 [Thalictrum thalictroides]|uniref:Cytochrome p450 n=1 Tax=Thalictrum thalictroides TaxID=46969 RepID=A0A7J6WYN5_THATH|nr:Cytochrome p450 [Thalictrum thalictroides]